MTICTLSNKFSFPKDKPLGIDLSIYPKWFNHNHVKYMNRYLNDNTKTILELGSWVGYSTRWFCEKCPKANILCIDHWKGSAEHSNFTNDQLDSLYDAFVLSMWDYRNQIIPIRMNTINGIKEVYDSGLSKEVEVIYIDASHQYEDVIVDIELCFNLFPNAILVGDDYNWRNPTQNNRRTVKEAVEYFSKKHNVSYNNNRHLWSLER